MVVTRLTAKQEHLRSLRPPSLAFFNLARIAGTIHVPTIRRWSVHLFSSFSYLSGSIAVAVQKRARKRGNSEEPARFSGCTRGVSKQGGYRDSLSSVEQKIAVTHQCLRRRWYWRVKCVDDVGVTSVCCVGVMGQDMVEDMVQAHRDSTRRGDSAVCRRSIVAGTSD